MIFIVDNTIGINNDKFIISNASAAIQDVGTMIKQLSRFNSKELCRHDVQLHVICQGDMLILTGQKSVQYGKSVTVTTNNVDITSYLVHYQVSSVLLDWKMQKVVCDHLCI